MADEIIQWGKLTSDERNILIHTKVMGNAPYVPCPGMVVNTKRPYTNPAGYSEWYIWKCDTCGEEYIEHMQNHRLHPRLPHDVYFSGKPEIPRYSESMDAAWELIRKMAQLSDDIFGEWWKKYEMLSNLGGTQFFEAEKDEMCVTLTLLASWTPERLCLAALRAVGYRMEEE